MTNPDDWDPEADPDDVEPDLAEEREADAVRTDPDDEVERDAVD